MSVYGKECELHGIQLQDLPNILSDKTTCPEIAGYKDIIQNKLGFRQPFVAINRNEIVAQVETYDFQGLNSVLDYPYIRPVGCKLLFDVGKN